MEITYEQAFKQALLDRLFRDLRSSVMNAAPDNHERRVALSLMEEALDRVTRAIRIGEAA